jgi:hypothetical protein
MGKEQVVFVKCQLMRGGFPSQCIFVIESPGGRLRGAAPIQYCYDGSRKRLKSELALGEEVGGFVTGIEIHRESGIVRVYLPDGELYEVSTDAIVPVKETESVPVGS